jgi:hypothetical protein
MILWVKFSLRRGAPNPARETLSVLLDSGCTVWPRIPPKVAR